MNAALLVMDFQNAIVALLDDPEPLLERAQGAIAHARANGIPVAYVRVAVTDADTLPEGSRFARLRDDDPATAIHPAVTPQDGEIVVRKVRVGAFSTTDLHERLVGVDTLVLAGISTSGVVLSTVRDAFDRDYHVIVLSDVCADPDPSIHAFLTEKIFPRQAEVVTLAQWQAQSH